jgi:redox-sensitive bicupin YhaK (pirin superfamily)
MSFQLPREPYVNGGPESAVETIIVPRTRDIGGFDVRRALPSTRRRMVGPFVFFDQMGPAVFTPGQGLDVRPHPHIGLATVTYLFAGELVHRDSLGAVQVIRPGAVNWMTAGGGIVHSERTPAPSRSTESMLFGVQAWVALPREHEETTPAFAHVSAEEIPAVDGDGVRVRIIAGSLFGARSPVRVFSTTIYADVTMSADARLQVPADHEERAVFVAEGAIEESGSRHASGRLLVLRPDAAIVLRAPEPARLLVLGGDAMDGPRHIWWNFVSSSAERIERAAADWMAGRFAPVPEETEFIPLPSQPRIPRYP